MTTVYGVTMYGAKLQIQRQLGYKEFPNEHILVGSRYLAEKTFKCLNNLFTSARQIQVCWGFFYFQKYFMNNWAFLPYHLPLKEGVYLDWPLSIRLSENFVTKVEKWGICVLWTNF